MTPDTHWVVYLVRCCDGSLYCGITNRLNQRIEAHNSGNGAKYTRSRAPVELLETSCAMTRSNALKLEHRIKKTPASRKLTDLLLEKARQEMENEQILVIQRELQSVVKNIQQLAGSIGAIVDAVETLTLTDPPRPARAKRAPTRKKIVIKNGVVETIKRIPASRIVFDIIRKSAQGIDTAGLMKATGFDQRKIHNITFRLKKAGRIKSGVRGIYEAA